MYDYTATYDGDVVRTLHLKHGLEERPLWKTLESLPLNAVIGWADRFDGLCPLAAEWALALALEESARVNVSRRTQYVRSIHAEINRLIWLTTYLSRVTEALRQRGLREEILLLREQVFGLTEELLGGRVLPNAFNLGICNRSFTVGEAQKVRVFAKSWRFQWARWQGFFKDPLIDSRLRNLLPLSLRLVEQMGWWGIVGKASGFHYDARKHRPYGAYPFLEFEIPSDFAGDALARVRMAQEEVLLSLALIEKFSAQIPGEDDKTSLPENIIVLDGLFTASTESPKGSFTAAVLVKEQRVKNIRIFSSAQRIWPKFETLLAGLRSDDLQLGIASLGIDPQEAETL